MHSVRQSIVNDRVTCLQLTPAYAERVSHMLDTSKNFKHGKFVDELGVLRRMPAYYDVCQRITTYADVCQRALNVYKTYP